MKKNSFKFSLEKLENRNNNNLVSNKIPEYSSNNSNKKIYSKMHEEIII